MKKRSAGLLVYRRKNETVEVLLGHMGSPWWAKKEKGAWSIPKGEYEPEENPLDTAKREFKEELGLEPPLGDYISLGETTQNNGKVVKILAVEGDIDASRTKSNTFKMEWPPRSGEVKEFPEIDRAGWFSLAEAAPKLIPAQVEFLIRLSQKLGQSFNPPADDSPTQSSLL